MHNCTAVTSWTLLYHSDLPVAPMQVNRSWLLERLECSASVRRVSRLFSTV